jgi:hypothetical protein
MYRFITSLIFFIHFLIEARSQCSIGPSPIPDNNGTGVSFSFTNQSISNWGNFGVQINFNPKHTWAGDLRATVQITGCGSADGSYILFNFQTSGLGSNCDMSGIYTFMRAGTNYLSANGGGASNPIPACPGGNVPTGTYTAAQQWPATGSCTNASITVTIVDNQAADVGSALVHLSGTSGCFPLPVKLISFSGIKVPGGVELTWATAQEINSSHFEIEYSANNSNWHTIATVPASGNTTHRMDYNYYHGTVIAELNYYRLKQVDLDGRTEYSNVLLIKQNFANRNSMQVAPHPATPENIQVQINSTEKYSSNLMIVDCLGRVVCKTDISIRKGLNNIRIADTKLPKGIYFILLTGNNYMFKEKLVIQ